MSAPSSRMLSLLSLLQVRRDWPGTELADRLGVSPRTIRRDVDQLRELGYAVAAVKGPDGGYRLDAGSELPPLLFDDDQIVALAIALRAAPGLGRELGEAGSRALATVRRVMPSRLRTRIEALDIGAMTGGGAEVDQAVLVAMSTAVHDAETLRFDYARVGSDAESTRRHVEPHGVVVSGGRWYLVAWDLDRSAWRAFRVDRITPRPPTRIRFRRRAMPGGSAEAFLRRTFRGSGDGAWPCFGEAIVATDASTIAPYLRVDDGTVEPLTDGRCRVRIGAWSWVGVASRLVAFDAPFEVVGPSALADAVGLVAARLTSSA
jgi:predicted DNA-binding transcriptional regulator YafY